GAMYADDLRLHLLPVRVRLFPYNIYDRGGLLAGLAVAIRHRCGNGEGHQAVEKAHRAGEVEHNRLRIWRVDYAGRRVVAASRIRDQSAYVVKQEGGAAGKIETDCAVDRILHLR